MWRLPPLAMSRRSRMAGFTLMEIMVVVIIIGVMIAIATLSTTLLGRDSESQDQVRRLWAVLQQAREEAELQSLDTGVFVTATGYEFLHFDARRNLWVPIENDKLYATRELPEGLRFRMWLESRQIVMKPDAVDREDKDAARKWPPQIIVLSSGEITPFELHVERDGAQAIWRVVALADNDLRIERRYNSEPWQVVAQTRPVEEEDDKRVSSARTQ